MVYRVKSLFSSSGGESIDAFWIKTKTHTFEIELVWTRIISLGMDDAPIRG